MKNAKRLLVLLLTACMVIAICGCSTPASTDVQTPNATEATKPKATEPKETEPTVVPLTLDNISQYVIFSVKCEDVVVEPAGYLDYDWGEGKAIVKTSPKKKAEFCDVVITVNVVTDSAAWVGPENVEIELAYDGTSENAYRIASRIESYVSDNPTYEIEVVAVSGSVTLG